MATAKKINVVTKGKEGEREIVNALEPIVRRVMTELEIPLPAGKVVQRNQNQSSVGGSDLANVFGLAIEVKRQESISLNAWWKQCTAAATRNNELPVLIYRQNHKEWRVVMNAGFVLGDGSQIIARAEMEWYMFLYWFERWVRLYLMRQGMTARV